MQLAKVWEKLLCVVLKLLGMVVHYERPSFCWRIKAEAVVHTWNRKNCSNMEGESEMRVPEGAGRDPEQWSGAVGDKGQQKDGIPGASLYELVTENLGRITDRRTKRP